MPCKSFMTREASATGRARGITALAVNSSSSKLLASSADHHIYMFDCIMPEREPVMYSGHVNSSFYVKSTFSPDGRFIMSGSTDNHVYLWDVANPLIPPLRLKGHTGEVSDVAWSPTEFWKLASSSDDTTVRVWTVDRAMSEHLRTHKAQPQAHRDESEIGRPDNAFINAEERIVYEHSAISRISSDTGAAEVPTSWSQPLQQSEEDRLTCHETMMFSDTLSSSQEPDFCEEDRSSASAVLSAAESPTQMLSRMSPPNSTERFSRMSPPNFPSVPSVMDGEINGGGAAGTTPRTVQAVRVRGLMNSSDDKGRVGSPTLKQPRLTDYFKQNEESPSRRDMEGELLEASSPSPKLSAFHTAGFASTAIAAASGSRDGSDIGSADGAAIVETSRGLQKRRREP